MKKDGTHVAAEGEAGARQGPEMDREGREDEVVPRGGGGSGSGCGTTVERPLTVRRDPTR